MVRSRFQDLPETSSRRMYDASDGRANRIAERQSRAGKDVLGTRMVRKSGKELALHACANEGAGEGARVHRIRLVPRAYAERRFPQRCSR
jgi:hypothetical protein